MKAPRAALAVPLPSILLAIAVVAAGARPAAAQEPPPARPTGVEITVGMGASVEPNPFVRGDSFRLLSVFATGGLHGLGPLGMEVGIFGNGASQVQPQRVALDLLAVVRPVEPFVRERTGYGYRVLRTVSLCAGPAYERVNMSRLGRARLGLGLGGHLDLPAGPAGERKEVRLRLAARRMLGGKLTLGDVQVGDSTVELFAALAVVF